MKKIIYITLAFIFTFMICGCENTGEYEFQDLEMLNNVINTELDNFTCICISSMIINVGKDEKKVDMELKTSVQDNKTYVSIKMQEDTIDVYEEKKDSIITSYIRLNNNEWSEPVKINVSRLENQLGILEFGQVDEKMFHYIEGVWIGNTKELEQLLNQDLMVFVKAIVKDEGMTIDDVFLKRFDIEIGYSKLKRQIIEVEFIGKYQDDDYCGVAKYIYNYSKIGNTIIKKPQGIKE